MRKVLMSLAAAASAVAISAPAAAQYYPARPVYAYNFQSVRALQMRVDQIQRNLHQLARFRVITRAEYNNRQQDARQIERKLRRDFRDGRGLNAREFIATQQRIDRLERRIARDMRDGRHYRYRW